MACLASSGFETLVWSFPEILRVRSHRQTTAADRRQGDVVMGKAALPEAC
jgi:hypothetical protein